MLNTNILLFMLGLSLSLSFGCGNNDANNLLPGSDASTDDSLDLSNDESSDLSADESTDLSSNECARNEYVVSNQCKTCAFGTSNESGDDATGSDTLCDDPCGAALGVACADLEQTYIKASNTDREDKFGHSVALSGDTLVVSASNEDSNATGINGDQEDDNGGGSGAVYVFVRADGQWSQQAYIKASNADAGDGFGQSVASGRSVAIEGDTLVVGALFESSTAVGVDGDQANNGAQESGAVYVFTRTDDVWTQQAFIKASNTEEGDFFGVSVALSADTLVVGASEEDSNATGVDGNQTDNTSRNSGAAYVFTRTGGTWSQQAYLKASNSGRGDWFGRAVALEADTLVVGALAEGSNAKGLDGDQANNDASGSGAAYVFTRTNGAWTQQAYLKASNTDANDAFGRSIALSANTLAIGARAEGSNATGANGDQADNDAQESGAVYVFTRANSAWTQQAYLKASNTGINDAFGGSIALSENTLVVGAAGESSDATGVDGDQNNDNAVGSGAAYVFTRTGETWSQQAYLKASNTDEGDEFGGSVALSGDTLVVGADEEDRSATGINGDQTNGNTPNSGAAYVYKTAP